MGEVKTGGTLEITDTNGALPDRFTVRSLGDDIEIEIDREHLAVKIPYAAIEEARRT